MCECVRENREKNELLCIDLLKRQTSARVFFHGYWRLIAQQGKGQDHLLFQSTISTRLWKLRHLFATLHVR